LFSKKRATRTPHHFEATHKIRKADALYFYNPDIGMRVFYGYFTSLQILQCPNTPSCGEILSALALKNPIVIWRREIQSYHLINKDKFLSIVASETVKK